MKQLILGGARSGKSALAQQLAEASGSTVTFIATATAEDTEMAERIAIHKNSRPSEWKLIEEPVQLAKALSSVNNTTVLVDCLTLWLSNVLALKEDMTVIAEFVSEVERFDGDLVIVSNEVGLGIVPMGELSRQFVDEAGRLHQQLASICDRVILTVAGIANVIKGEKLEF